MRRLSLLLLVAVATLGVCGRSGEQAQGSAAGDSGWRGTLLASRGRSPTFTLTATDGQPYDFRPSTDGYLTLLFFGYTHCPDVCPLHMANLAAVLDELPGDVRANTKVVFATTDPARDTPARLKNWLATFDPTFIGLTGYRPTRWSPAQEAAGVPVAGAEPPDGDGSYVVGHAAQVIAYTRDGEAHVVYPFGTRQARLGRRPPPPPAGAGVEPVTGCGARRARPAGARRTEKPSRGRRAAGRRRRGRRSGRRGAQPAARTGDGSPVLHVEPRSSARATEEAAGYLTIVNDGGPDELVAVVSDAGRRRRSTARDRGGAVVMERDTSVGDRGDATTALRPGATHLMLEELDRPLGPVTRSSLVLSFGRPARCP